MNPITIKELFRDSHYGAERSRLRKIAALDIIYRTLTLSVFLNLSTYPDTPARALETLGTAFLASTVAVCEPSGHLRLGNTA
ncbi:MAG: hypothetical protein ACI80L_002577 [Pseudohongiellaceae bacterium]|jgi:hypothetical protein